MAKKARQFKKVRKERVGKESLKITPKVEGELWQKKIRGFIKGVLKKGVKRIIVNRSSNIGTDKL